MSKTKKEFMPAGEIPGIFTPEREKNFFQKLGRKNLTILIIVVLLLLGVGGFVFYKRSVAPTEVLVASQNETTETKTSAVLNAPATVEEQSQIPLFGDANYQSENFRVGDISIGGEAEFLLSEDNPEPLEINSIRGEAFTEKNKQEVKLVVSWRTNKLEIGRAHV